MEEKELTEDLLFERIDGMLNEDSKVVIAVSGTPGVGKTTISKKISDKFGLKYFDLNEYAKKNGFSIEFNEKQDTHVIDTEKLFGKIERVIDYYKKGQRIEEGAFRDFVDYKGVILDSHFSHDILNEYVDLCIIVRAELKDLKIRLEKRGYSKEKIEENVDSEIFEVCLTEAVENNHEVVVFKN